MNRSGAGDTDCPPAETAQSAPDQSSQSNKIDDPNRGSSGHAGPSKVDDPADHDDPAREEKPVPSSAPRATNDNNTPPQQAAADTTTQPPLNNSNTPPGPYEGGQYSTVGPGWPAMAKIIREVDEQKIQDYEKDIDGILIFAGLFSAAMTAFLVESYQNLSQDPTQVMILLMQQLTAQTHSYSVNGGFLNSTVPPMPTIPPFQPTANAIRVNVLWFASLTLTLVSASFSILVKQWLREFLAGEYTSPQARLRVRHFRRPGLEHWKVFEIAGVLPLLLQLALALFLVGLCFFTADVHHALECITLPLVAGWGLLILAVSCAPAFSPGCPYKTALLKSTMKKVRQYLAHAVLLWAKDPVAVRGSNEALETTSERWYDLLSWEEEKVAMTNSNDIDILIAVDTIQSDDRLFDIMLGIILESIELSQHSTTAGRKTDSLLKLLRHRSKRNNSEAQASFMDLSDFPEPTMTSVMNIVASMLKKEINPNSAQASASTVIEWSDWMEDCVYILFSHTTTPMPVAADELLSFILGCGVYNIQALYKVITARVPVTSSNSFSHILSRLTGAITLTYGDQVCRILKLLLDHYFCPLGANHEHEDLFDMIRDHPEIPSQHLSQVVKLLTSVTKDAIISSRNRSPEWTVYASLMLYHLYALDATTMDQCRADIQAFVRFFLITKAAWRCLSVIIAPCFSLREYSAFYTVRESAREVCIQATVTSSPDEMAVILYTFATIALTFANRNILSDTSVPRDENTVDPLHASLVFLRLLKALGENGMSTDSEMHAHLICGFITAIQEGLETVARMHDLWKDDYRASAIRCLELVSELDVCKPPAGGDREAFTRWEQKPSMPETFFSDSFIETIALYLPGQQEEFLVSCRIRRLLLPRTVSDEAAGGKPIDEGTVTPSLPSNSSALQQSASPSSQLIPRSKISSIEHTSGEPELGEHQAPSSDSESVPVDGDSGHWQGTPLDLTIGVGSRTDNEIPKHRDDTFDDGSNDAKAPEDLASARSDAEGQASARANMNEASGSGMGGQGDPDEVDFVEYRPELAGAMEVDELGDTEIDSARRNGQPEAGHGGGFSVSTDMDA